MKITENLSRSEYTALMRFYILRDKRLQVTVLALISGAIIGLLALWSSNPIVIQFFIVYVSAYFLLTIIRIIAEYWGLKCYGITQYPQSFEFSDHGMNINNSNGILIQIPWRQVNSIKTGRKYHNIVTVLGVFWIRKAGNDALGPEIVRLWRTGCKRNENINLRDMKSVQQVDSAEASTIAVPPSDPSGSPR